MKIDRFEFTSKGGRERNEDAVISRSIGDKGVFIVSDGLGGHKDGDLASRTAVSYLTECWLNLENHAFTREWMETTINDTNRLLMSIQEEKRSNLRCTLALLLIDGEKSAWANVGDSRVYFIRDGELARVSEDHSMAFLKFKAGDILRSELAGDPDQSRLLRSLGDKERNNPDIYENARPIKDGDAFLLCSDGVWEYLNDIEVMSDYLKSTTAREWGELLLLRVIERIHPGNDNLSLITVRISTGGGV